MRKITRRLLLISGILLCFGNNGSLFAGMISRADVIESKSSSSYAELETTAIAAVCASTEQGEAESSAFAELAAPINQPEGLAADESLALFAEKPESVCQKSTGCRGLDLLDENCPMPREPRPSGHHGGENASGMGTVPTGSSHDQPVAMHTWLWFGTNDQITALSYRPSHVNSAPTSPGLFRPPRAS